MTDIAIKLSQEENRWIDAKKFSSQLWEQYSDLISSICITTLDAIYLTGECSSFFSKSFTNISFLLLNLVGIISFGFSWDALKKHINDVKICKRYSQNLMLAGSIIKVCFIASSILLITLGASAALLRHASYLDIMKTIHHIIAPIGAFCVGVSFFQDLFYFALAKKTVNRWKIGFSDNAIDEMIFFFIKKKNDISADVLYYSIVSRCCMDKDTWAHLVSQLKEIPSLHTRRKIVRTILQKNLQTQTIFFASNIFLRILGDIGMAIAALYPASFTQAIIWISFSSFYTIKLIAQKYKQAKERHETTMLAKMKEKSFLSHFHYSQ